MKSIQIECIVFRKKDDSYEFLLLKRFEDKGGFWQPPCGGLEESDSSKLDACFREIFEETGIKKEDVIRVFEDVHYFEMDKHYITGEPIPLMKEYVFAFEVFPEVVVVIDKNTCDEHETFGWFGFDDALKLLKWEDNKESLRKLKELL